MTDAALVAAFDRARASLPLAAALRATAAELEAEASAAIPSHVLETIDHAATFFDTTRAAILGRSQCAKIARARAVCWWVLRRTHDVSFPEIARIWKRDPSAAQKVLRSFLARLPEDARARAAIQAINGTTSIRRAA